MKLAELDPSFRRIQELDADGDVATHEEVASIADAQGVMFLCPLCFERNGGSVGTHMVLCWSRSKGVPDTVSPKPGRWTLEGSGMDDLTLGCEPGLSRSVLLLGGCAWHGFVTNGEVTGC